MFESNFFAGFRDDDRRGYINIEFVEGLRALLYGNSIIFYIIIYSKNRNRDLESC